MLSVQMKIICSSIQRKLLSHLKHTLRFQEPLITKLECSRLTKSYCIDWTKQEKFQQNQKDDSTGISANPHPVVRTFHQDPLTDGKEDAGNSTYTEDLTLHNITHRNLVCLEGPDSINFLQGLLTSDVTLLGTHTPAQYSMMLNAQGRVLYDLILYFMNSKIFIECDAKVTDDFINTIKKYKIRKKVQISKAEEMTVQAVVTSSMSGKIGSPTWNKEVFCVKDPRVKDFGWRLIHSSGTKVCDEKLEEKDLSVYHERRYIWGISEGTTDLPPGECFPLESNLALFNGVSFSKGCYIGQELTARTQHTGMTRKRLMPIVFQKVPSGLQTSSNISREDGKNVGKFRNAVGIHGIGLLRIAEITGELCMYNSEGNKLKLTAHVPHWWPK